MKMLLVTLIIAVGSLCSLVAVHQHNHAATSQPEVGPRFRVPNELRISERRNQVRAIVKVFARRTSYERAKQLARLCYYKTLNTPFTPVDLAEIALAETGGHKLSAKAVSSRGALGVWQLMPVRAKSHGYRPAEMRNDEKCADAAVRELQVKLVMARGDLMLAKKYYCGIGPDADYYESKRQGYRRELLLAMPASAREWLPEATTQVASVY